METPPPDSDSKPRHHLSDAAWKVLAHLLTLGRPAPPSDLASNSTSPDFISFLCTIPNSPIKLTDNRLVTISRLGFDSLANFFMNNDTTPSLNLNLNSNLDLNLPPPCDEMEMERSEGVIKTYYRKRKRTSCSEVEDFSIGKKRISLGDFDGDKEVDERMALSLTGDVGRSICDQGNILDGNMNQSVAILSRLSQAFGIDCKHLENVMFTPSLCKNYHSGQSDNETQNVEHGGSAMEGNFCIREELCYLLQTSCQPDSLFGGRLHNLLAPKLAENIMISVPYPEQSRIQCITDISGDSKDEEMNIVCPITKINDSKSCCLEVEQKMPVLRADSEAQPCGSLIENVGRNTEGVLPQDSDRCLGHMETLPIDTTYIDEHRIDDSGKAVAAINNVVLSPNRTRTMVCLQSQRDMSSSSVPNADQKDEATCKKRATCQTAENLECIDPIKEEPQTYRRDKKPIPVVQKTKCDPDMHMKSKGKRETSIENRKNAPSTSIKTKIEEKPFPNIESFIIHEEEGSGGYGTVYRARRKSDGVTFAIKCPHVNAHRSIVQNELKMLERLGGKNFVIKYEGSVKSGSSDCLILEHVEHDRPEALKREINIYQLQWYGFCLFKALASLHKQGIAHRDVKPGNFLFSRTVNKGYLIDFNLALDLNKKHGTNDDHRAGQDVNFDRVPVPRTKSLPAAKEKKLTNTSIPHAVNQNARKGSKSLLPPGSLKKKADQANTFTESSSRNIIRTQGTDGSGITSTKDATSSRVPSIEKFRGPAQMPGRKELLSLVQQVTASPRNESVNAPTSKRKRVAASPRNAESNFLYPTPMPLHARGMTISGGGLLKSNGKHKREGPCVGTKGFRAPEVLFRSLYQGPKVDIWSAGVTLLYLMIGKTPFCGDPEENIKEIAKLRGSEALWEVAKLHNNESLFPTELLDVKHLSAPKLRDWCVQNTRRPDILEVIPKSLFDLVDKCLTVNPRLRISAEEALRHEFFTPCQEALRKQRLQRQGVSLDTATSKLQLRTEFQACESSTQKSGQLEEINAPRNILQA